VIGELANAQIISIVLAALLVGFSKTSVGGVGILAVLLMALAIPGKGSPGVLLPMLILADIFAVIYYRRHCQWGILLRLVPLTAVGVVIGYLLVDIIPVDIFQILLGFIILSMLVIEVFLPKNTKGGGPVLTGFVGIAAGIATMIANAAGPIFGVYLLRMGLKKEEFVGTRSWFFLLLNVFKIPFSMNLGLITAETLKLDLFFIPVILLGAFLGYVFLKHINMVVFKWLIRTVVVIAAIRLILF